MTLVLSFDETSSIQSWITVDDIVMGGRSLSRLRWLDEDAPPGGLRFEGDISLENNGGFCSTRTQGQWNLHEAKALTWTLQGTPRGFMATLRDATTPEGASFRYPFVPHPHERTDVYLPLDEFRLFRRGQKLSPHARIDPSQIVSLGFLLADRSPGPFRLDILALSV